MNTALITTRQMISAELLRLRRKRSLLAWSALLSLGSVIVYFAVAAIQHAGAPGVHAPAGGLSGFRHAVGITGLFLGPLAAVLIGAEAGAGDRASGVFRDLAMTGRSRLALFGVRVPGALLLALPLAGLAYGLGVLGTFAFAGGLATPSTAMVLEGLGWVLLANGVICALATGLGSLLDSRPATITALIGFELVATPLLLGAGALGVLRRGLLGASFTSLAPVPVGNAPALSDPAGVAVTVIAVWVLVALGLGAWRTLRADA